MFHKDTPAKCFPRSSVNSQPASSGASCATKESIPALGGGAQTLPRRCFRAGVIVTMHIGELGHPSPDAGDLAPGDVEAVGGVTEGVDCRAPLTPVEQPATPTRMAAATAATIRLRLLPDVPTTPSGKRALGLPASEVIDPDTNALGRLERARGTGELDDVAHLGVAEHPLGIGRRQVCAAM